MEGYKRYSKFVSNIACSRRSWTEIPMQFQFGACCMTEATKILGTRINSRTDSTYVV